MDIVYCPWEPATYLFVSSNVPLLIHYSHFIAIFAALGIAFLVFFHDTRSITARLFVLFAALFSVWAFLDVILWATNDPGIVMFAWSMQVLLEPFTYTVAFYLYYRFLNNRFPSLRTNLVVALLLLPLIVLLPTTLNLEALSLSACESIEGPIAKYYTYFLNLSFVGMIVLIGIKYIPTLDSNRRKSGFFFITGLVTFLLAFTSGNIISSFTDDWTISQYGLFGMPVFAFIMAYSIVRFRTFKMEVVWAQILVIALVALVASLLLVDEELETIVILATLTVTSVIGFFLVKSVRREFEQKLELEKLTAKLATANERLKQIDKLKSEFVSIASHQLRSPITAIRGYASLLLDGDYGKLPQKSIEALARIEESAKRMALSIEDYLNVSRIESGNMHYDYSDFSLKNEVDKICDDMRPEAIQKGLGLIFRSKGLTGQGMVHADLGKSVQIVQNLINNAIKYTPDGSINVHLRDDAIRKLVFVDVVDTGVGIAADELEIIFEKFERARNANKVNTTGTGLGLFVAIKMAKEMGGDITVHSDGEGKGSRFTFSLPMIA